MRKLVLAALVLSLIPSSSGAQAQDQQPCPFVYESQETLFVESFVGRMMCLQQSLTASTAQLAAPETAPSFGAPAEDQSQGQSATESATPAF